MGGRHGGVVVSTVASQQEGSWFDPGCGSPSVRSLHVLPVSAWVLSGYSGFLPQSKDMQVGDRLIGDSKLTVGVNVSMNGCLSLRVSPATVWRPVQGVPCLSPNVSWDRLQPPRDPQEDKRLEDGWMDTV